MVSQPALPEHEQMALPLGVKVRGQAPGKAPVVTATDGTYNGAVQVGISDPWIMNARLSPRAIEIPPRESLALLIKRVPPVYPEAARLANIQGSVVLKVVIRKDGNVGDLRAVSGDPLLAPAAIDSVRQWVYKPYYRDGAPAEVETVVVVELSLAAQAASAIEP
jgi:TonB family protein